VDSALSVKDLSLNIGGAKILDGITLDVAHNETLGIIGPNGAGKTSFFNLLSGIHRVAKSSSVRQMSPDFLHTSSQNLESPAPSKPLVCLLT
jgi:branched-chain amino acid transport system ATP-binding protein